MRHDTTARETLDTEEELRLAREAFRRVIRRANRVSGLLPVLLLLLIIGWLATGIYMVNPGEQGVVRQFGREIARTAPGLHYHLPAPIEQVDVVNVQAIRRLEVGFRTQQGQPARVAAEAHMLTGDENIVDLQMIVQYRVRDASEYLFRIGDPEMTLQVAAQVAIRSVVGNMVIDDVLTTRRGEAQDQTLKYLQTLMDAYQSGLLVTEVRLQVVDPPDQVKDAFNEVVRAREDREKQQNEAQAYREDILPKARGQAEQTVRAAEAYQQERVLQAQGDVARFRSVLQEYRKGIDVTRERLYLETIERVMAGVGKVVVDGSIGDKAVPFLPLNEMLRGGTQQPQTTTQPQSAPTEQPQPAPQPAPQPQQAPQPKPQPTAAPRR